MVIIYDNLSRPSRYARRIDSPRPAPGLRGRRQVGAGLALVACLAGCAPQEPGTTLSATSHTVHLEEALDAARTETSAPSLAALRNREWRFWEEIDDGAGSTDPAAEWHPLALPFPGGDAASVLSRDTESLRVTVNPVPSSPIPVGLGGLHVELDGLDPDDWESVLITARTTDRFMGVLPLFRVEDGAIPPASLETLPPPPEMPPIFNDGQEHTYAFPIGADADGEWNQFAFLLVGVEPDATMEILSIELVPVGADYTEAYGATIEARGDAVRRALYAHTPARLSYDILVPEGARLDFGLGVARGDVPVDFRIGVTDAGDDSSLLQEQYADKGAWAQRSVDLSAFAGRTVTLTLEADAREEGTLAFWAAPILSGATVAAAPNIIFYVIDGGGADFMSVYGYNRRTTPFMEQLADEGVVFERAFTNSTWTQPSTASFMTSLQHSVLGGLNRGIHSTPIPPEATTMAEHLHAGGYQTASFTTNPNASRMIGLQRGMDVLRDAGPRELVSTSTIELHEDFWRFRAAYPGAPYWVHFQTTDVHEPHEPVAPFSGLFASPEARREFVEQDELMFSSADFDITSVHEWYERMFEASGVDRRDYYGTMRDLYDETMAHQDYRLRQLVDGLKAAGEWDNTLLIIAADHGHPAGTFARFGRGILDPPPDPWEGALFDSFNTRVPLIFVWPAAIEGGRRFAQPVSMIDVLPTVLDLAGLPQPEILQGQSLAPLLRGQSGWQARPVILDEFRVDPASGEMTGNLEIIDGRWGASLEIRPLAEGEDPALGRHAIPAGGRWGAGHPFFPDVPRLLLYDLSTDPFATRNVNDRYPELVSHYTELLEAQWEAHRALAQRFGSSEEAALTPDQLRTLRALGYIR